MTYGEFDLTNSELKKKVFFNLLAHIQPKYILICNIWQRQ